MYLGGVLCGEEGVRRRAQAGANAWRAVEVVMTDRRIFKRLKVMSTLCDTGMPVQKGNLGNERTTTTKAASIRKQLGTKNSKTTRGERLSYVRRAE